MPYNVRLFALPKLLHIFWVVTILFFPTAAGYAQTDLLIPLPTTISTPPAKKTPKKQPSPVRRRSSNVILGLPSTIRSAPAQSPQKLDQQRNPESILPLPLGGKTQPVISNRRMPSQFSSYEPSMPQESLQLPGEIVVTPQDVPPSQEPTSTMQGSNDNAAGAALPVFPKDTSSAAFMVMKTWECQNYDGGTLLEHAVGVYGQEAEDRFKIAGLDAIPPFQLTINEEDITLDELLDVISNQTSCDWGVDIPQKTIYLYAKKKE